MKNFTNNGTIESKDQNAAVRLQGAKIETFKNEKLISATKNAVAIKIESNKTKDNANGYDGSIGTFINEGTISAAGQGIGLTNATITNFTNSGTIKASNNNAVYLKESTIETFINETNGIIENGSTYSGNLNNAAVPAAIYLEGSYGSKNTITSFENKGTIKAKRAGIFIFGTQGTTITHLKNSGTIEINNGNSNVNSNNVSAGILIAQLNMQEQPGSNPIYDTIENTGIIKGGDYGIFIEGGSIKNLKNSGTIEGKKDGIAFFNAGGPLHTTITNLEIEGTVKGGENGINLSRIEFDRRNNETKNERIVENLTIKEGAIVEGKNGSGLVLGNVEDKRNNKNTNGQNNGENDTYQLTGKIEVNGTLKGKTAGIINYRDMGTEGKDVLVIGSKGKIEGVVKNESGGTLKGNITNNGNGTLEIDNQGKTGNNTVIKNDGSGEIKIKDWKLENQGNGNDLKVIKFEGSGSGNITLEKLTISEGNTDITKVANAIQGSKKAEAVAHTQVQTSGGNGAVTITGDLLRGREGELPLLRSYLYLFVAYLVEDSQQDKIKRFASNLFLGSKMRQFLHSFLWHIHHIMIYILCLFLLNYVATIIFSLTIKGYA